MQPLPEQVWVRVVSGMQAGRCYPLPVAGGVLGRAPGCDVVLDDTEVSRRHAEIRRQGGSFVLRDLGSRNGALVAGRPIRGPLTLGKHAQFRLGGTLLEFTAAVGCGIARPRTSLPPICGTPSIVRALSERRQHRRTAVWVLGLPAGLAILARLLMLDVGRHEPGAAPAAVSAAPAAAPTSAVQTASVIALSPLPAAPEAAGAGGALSPAEVYARTRPATVLVACRTDEQRGSVGTGIVFDARGLALTARHVVADGCQPIVVAQAGGARPARLAAQDEDKDLAVLSFGGAAVTAAAFGDPDRVQQGDAVVALGYPDVVLEADGVEVARPSLDPNVATGIVVNLRRGSLVDAPLVQTDAPLDHGSSGGPLLNVRGEVIGLNDFKLERAGGDTTARFAIAIAAARPLMARAAGMH